jgi:hypothetical protein
MKRFVRSCFVFACAAALAAFSPSAFAQINTSTIATSTISASAHLNVTTYSVTLTATPANQVGFGNPVTLTARVMALPPNTMASGATPVPSSHVRFTFKAQMTSPCAGMNPIAIATNAGPVASWNPPKGGNYNVTVHVTRANTLIPVIPRLPDVIGDATLNYVVTGGPAQPANLPFIGINTTLVPPSGSSSAPASVTITATVSSPPAYAAIYKISANCDPLGGGAPVCTGASTTTFSSPATSANLQPLHMATAGNYFITIGGTMIRQSDCEITGLLYTHVSYTVNP